MNSKREIAKLQALFADVAKGQKKTDQQLRALTSRMNANERENKAFREEEMRYKAAEEARRAAEEVRRAAEETRRAAEEARRIEEAKAREAEEIRYREAEKARWLAADKRRAAIDAQLAENAKQSAKTEAEVDKAVASAAVPAPDVPLR